MTLNPDLVTAIRWWRHPSFGDRVYRQAAELIAFRVLDPVLRSRGAISAVLVHAGHDSFYRKLKAGVKAHHAAEELRAGPGPPPGS